MFHLEQYEFIKRQQEQQLINIEMKLGSWIMKNKNRKTVSTIISIKWLMASNGTILLLLNE